MFDQLWPTWPRSEPILAHAPANLADLCPVLDNCPQHLPNMGQLCQSYRWRACAFGLQGERHRETPSRAPDIRPISWTPLSSFLLTAQVGEGQLGVVRYWADRGRCAVAAVAGFGSRCSIEHTHTHKRGYALTAHTPIDARLLAIPAKSTSSCACSPSSHDGRLVGPSRSTRAHPSRT